MLAQRLESRSIQLEEHKVYQMEEVRTHRQDVVDFVKPYLLGYAPQEIL